jgi:zinc protease
MTREDLYGHYRRYYNPANAVVVAAGDFDTETMLARIEAHFGDIPAGEPAEFQIRPEPPLRGERRVTVNGPGDAAYLAYSFRVPEATHDDFYPLVLLDAAYAGGGGIGHFGGGTTNKSSRLYKALVSTDLAAGVSGSVAPSVDPYLYTIFAVARPGVTLVEIESALEDELERLGQEPLTQEELDKAIKRARAAYVLAGESVTGQAQMIGMAEAVAGDYHWYEKTLDALASVTLDDIERVRKSYLRPGNRVVALYQPVQNGQS